MASHQLDRPALALALARLALARLVGPFGPGPGPFPFRDQFQKLFASPMSIPILIPISILSIPIPIMSIPLPIFPGPLFTVFKNAFFEALGVHFSGSRFS